MRLSTRVISAVLLGMLLSVPVTAATSRMESILSLPREAFKVSKSNPNQYYYVKPGADLHQYQSILVAPLVILHQGEGDDWSAMVTDSNGTAPKFFQDQLTLALQKQGFQVVTQPGPGVLRLQVAVTHIRQDHPGFSVTDVLPAKAVFNLARYALGKSPYIVKVSTLAELTDSRSGSLLAGGIGLREEDKSGAEPMTLDDLQSFMVTWSGQVAQYVAKFVNPPAP